MPIQQPVQRSRAHRWAHVCGMSVKRGYRRLKTFESRVVERAETVGMPAGKFLVRASFLTAKLALLGVFLFVSFWLFVLCFFRDWAVLRFIRQSSIRRLGTSVRKILPP